MIRDAIALVLDERRAHGEAIQPHSATPKSPYI